MFESFLKEVATIRTEMEQGTPEPGRVKEAEGTIEKIRLVMLAWKALLRVHGCKEAAENA